MQPFASAKGPAAGAPTAFSGRWLAIAGSDGSTVNVWEPISYTGAKTPLVVVLAPGPQDKVFFADHIWSKEADETGFFLLALENPDTEDAEDIRIPGAPANPTLWPFYREEKQTRDSAYLESLLKQVRTAVTSDAINIDAKRVFLTGLFDGAGMAVVLAAAYPDVFAGVAVVSGYEYGVARDLATFGVAARLGGPDPDQQGTAAFNQMGKAARPVKVFNFNVNSDKVVPAVHAAQITQQWAQTNDLADNGKDDGSVSANAFSERNGDVKGNPFRVRCYERANQRAAMEWWAVDHYEEDAWERGLHEETSSHFIWPDRDANGPDLSDEIARFLVRGGSGCEPGPPPDLGGLILNRTRVAGATNETTYMRAKWAIVPVEAAGQRLTLRLNVSGQVTEANESDVVPQRLDLKVIAEHPITNLDIELFSPDGRHQIARSTKIGNDERIIIDRPLAPGEYLLDVYPSTPLGISFVLEMDVYYGLA